MFVTWLVVLKRKLDKHPSSCWSVQVRSPHFNQRHHLSSTLARGDLRQHNLQCLQWRRRGVQLWPRVRLVLLRDPPRAHVGLPWLSLVSLCPSCLDGCPSCPAQAHFSGDSCVHLVATDVLHFLTSCPGAQLWIEPPAIVVISTPSFPHAEQLLLITVHEFLHFTMHVSQVFVLLTFTDNIFQSSLRLLPSSSAPASPTRACPLSAAPQLLEQLGVPMPVCSPLSIVLFVLTRACRCLPVHLLHSNLSRGGDCSHACVDKPRPSFVTRGQPEHA